MTVPQRVLVVAILASFVSFLDGSVVNVALPAISDELTTGPVTGLALQQWVVDAYMITLGALILLAGSLSDVHGRRRVLAVGLVGFAVTSVACAVAPDGLFLVVARGLQGVAGALLVPSSLAMIISTFDGARQARAIGAWTAWTSTASIVGPLLGGVLVDAISWRWVFWINVLPVAWTLWLLRGIPRSAAEEEGSASGRRIDVLGATLAAVGLAGTVFALIEQGRFGWASPVVWVPAAVGAACLVGFVAWERRAPDPMLPPRLFRIRNFAWGNLATAAIYGALYFGGFVVTLFLQQVGGYSATAAGLAQIPVTLLLIGLSTRFGALAGRFGPRLFMTVGPLVGGAGYLLLLTTTEEAAYLTQVLPGLALFGLGLAMTVAPLTSAILGSIPAADAGIGSAVNNAVSRVAGLVVIALAGVIVGGALDLDGFHRSLVVTAALLVLGGVLSWVGIRDEHVRSTVPR
ncbi:DHA2 family efflux MFS transporter permease subunit [Cellulosimicrobium marinum]|uniref:DHA2 family efflux MFS transporter permease subunit n=1 Tax=Cellulosimicrobium marinum TaxID=1638992 RepID=UPI001E4759DD|nr:DHA2 family efflux MFS transporter permease subunit [Cellulosimicrobium marinum]MCB7135342.1 DHA2 family efflux MFS transporter permease subunit [Cellulosimicrobium marinum]